MFSDAPVFQEKMIYYLATIKLFLHITRLLAQCIILKKKLKIKIQGYNSHAVLFMILKSVYKLRNIALNVFGNYVFICHFGAE
jgi:hypothetical protein